MLTHYSAHSVALAARKALLATPWLQARDAVLKELASVHGDLLAKTTQVNITRYDHAMAVPVPRTAMRVQPAMPHLAFAYSDWACYSVFEQAFEQGVRAVRGLI